MEILYWEVKPSEFWLHYMAIVAMICCIYPSNTSLLPWSLTVHCHLRGPIVIVPVANTLQLYAFAIIAVQKYGSAIVVPVALHSKYIVPVSLCL